MFASIQAALKDDAGQGLVEYGLILSFVSVVCIAALTLLGGNIKTLLNTVAGDV